jgi:hypothetical protein
MILIKKSQENDKGFSLNENMIEDFVLIGERLLVIIRDKVGLKL